MGLFGKVGTWDGRTGKQKIQKKSHIWIAFSNLFYTYLFSSDSSSFFILLDLIWWCLFWIIIIIMSYAYLFKYIIIGDTGNHHLYFISISPFIKLINRSDLYNVIHDGCYMICFIFIYLFLCLPYNCFLYLIINFYNFVVFLWLLWY